MKKKINNPSLRPLYPPFNKGYENHNHWTDYIELLCLTNPDHIITKSEVLDKIREIVDDVNEEEPFDENLDKEKLYEDDELSRSEINDKWDIRVDDWFKLLASRENFFNEFYPFKLDDSGSMLKKINPNSLKRTLYLILLFSSNLEYIKNEKNDLTASFEVLSRIALKKILPLSANTFLFGKHKLNSGRYKGKLWVKVKDLAFDLGELELLVKEDDFAQNDTGDGGLDIVGWITLENNFNKNIPVFFGQCACGIDWHQKIDQSSFQTWSSIINLSTFTNNIIFIPFSYRKINGNWQKDYILKKTIIIDRFRILYQFKNDKLSFLKKLPSFLLVKKLLETKYQVI